MRLQLTGPLTGLIGLLLLLHNPAQAQTSHDGSRGSLYGPYDPYNWNVYNEGPGIRLFHDGLVFHPGLSTELGYDSNVLLRGIDVVDAGLLRLRLHLDLATLPPQRRDASYRPKLEFRAGGMFEYRQYFSTNPDVSFANQLNGLLNADLAIKPHDPLSLRMYTDLLFTNDVRNLQQASTQGFVPRMFFRYGLLGTFRPGNGPLELGLGDQVRLDYYIPDELRRNRSFANDANVYAQLRVLPQTTIKLEARVSYITYYDTPSFLPNSLPVRVIAAANSLLIPALGVTLFAGYGNSVQLGTDGFPQLGKGAGVNYSNFIGGAEIRLRLLARMRLSLGYARDFFDSIFSTWLSDDRLYLYYDHYIWRGLVAHLRFDTYFRQYGALVPWTQLGYTGYASGSARCESPMDPGSCTLGRSDVIINLAADLNYRVLSWMEVGVGYSLLNDITDFRFLTGGGGSEPASFVKHMLLGKIDIAY